MHRSLLRAADIRNQVCGVFDTALQSLPLLPAGGNSQARACRLFSCQILV